MFHLDNSETSWLVYADWLEDQDINAAHIRELNPITNDWHWVECFDGVGSILYSANNISPKSGVGCDDDDPAGD